MILLCGGCLDLRVGAAAFCVDTRKIPVRMGVARGVCAIKIPVKTGAAKNPC